MSCTWAATLFLGPLLYAFAHIPKETFFLQMTDLVDIARCVAGTDLSEEGSHEFLLACMQDLQDVLRHSKYKALLVDTFGGRIENLLR